MHMEHAFDILVIVLSIVLFILLVVAIIATIFIVKLVRSLRKIAEKGVHIADKVEQTAESIKESANVAGLVRAAGEVVTLVGNSKKRKG